MSRLIFPGALVVLVLMIAGAFCLPRPAPGPTVASLKAGEQGRLPSYNPGIILDAKGRLWIPGTTRLRGVVTQEKASTQPPAPGGFIARGPDGLYWIGGQAPNTYTIRPLKGMPVPSADSGYIALEQGENTIL